MSEPTPQPSPEPITPERSDGFFQNLIDVYLAPREAFGRIVSRPAWLLPLVGSIILALVFTTVWMSRMEPEEFMKTQLQESGQWDELTPEQREGFIAQQAKVLPIFAPISAVVMTPITLLAMAGALLFVFRFFYAGNVGFKQSFSIVSWSWFAYSLLTTPLTLGVMALKEDWNLNPQDALQANLGLLMDKAETAKPLWALVTSLDLFSFWVVFLLATGFGVACKKATGSALWGVVIPWALIVGIKVGWSAMF
jgi:hypothetical protein